MKQVIYFIITAVICANCNYKKEQKTNSFQGEFGIYYSSQLIYDSITKEVEVLGKPVIDIFDIVSFDSIKNIFKLSKTGIDKLKSLKVPQEGLSMTIGIGKKPIYSFALFRIESSFCCPEFKLANFYPGIDEFKIETASNLCNTIYPRFNFRNSRVINKYFEKSK